MAQEDTLPLLERIEATLSAFHDRAASLEHMNLEMHQRMQLLQEDAVFSYLRPLFNKLAITYSKAVEYALDQEDEQTKEDLNSIAEQLLDVFQLFDIQSVKAAPGVQFDAHFHNAIQKKTTDDPKADGIISRVHRQGFIRSGAGRVFIPAQVAIFRYESPSLKPSEEDQPISNANWTG